MATSDDERTQKKIKQGEQFTEWLKKVTKRRSPEADAKPAEIARATGLSYNRVNRLLYHNCREKDGRVNLPEEATIKAIADAYKVDPDEALIIVGIMPDKIADNVFVTPPGMRRDDLITGHILFSPQHPRGDLYVRLVEAYIQAQIDLDNKID